MVAARQSGRAIRGSDHVTSILERLLGVPPELLGQPWHWALQRSMPAWALVLLAAGLALAAWLSYLGLRGTRPARAALSTLRFLSLTTVGMLLLGPSIEWPRERTERDLVHVLVDRSSSMLVRDERSASGDRRTRDEVAMDIVRGDVWKRLNVVHDVSWHALGARAAVVGGPNDLPAADGRRTLIAASIEDALRQSGGRPVSAIVIVTDGRSQDSIDGEVLRRLKASGAPVIAVAVGDPSGVADRAILEVEHPARAFPRDRVPVQVTVSTGDTQPVRVVLREQGSGRVLEERTETPGIDRRVRTTLMGTRGEAGDANWEVAIVPEGQDADATNDTRTLRMSFVDRPLRVLYLEGWPRWEYRYLKNLLLREDGFESSVMLLSADRDFAQEGTAPIARLPVTESEFAPFDVVVIGDVPGGFLDEQRQRIIREQVARRGAGVLWIGGERATPGTWRGTPLEDLLPFRGSLDVTRWDEPVTMRSTPLANRLGLLQVGETPGDWPVELSNDGAAWARLEWAQRIDARELKPTVETWATAEPAVRSTNSAVAPLVVSMRFGAGSIAYVGTDETWRWRNGRGETLPERFWIQIIRHLARGGLRGDARNPALEVEPSSAAIDQPVRITLDGPDAHDDRVMVEARRADGAEVIEVTLVPEGSGRFGAAWTPPREGEWKLRVAPNSGVDADTATLQVRSEELERVDASPDHASLQRLVDATGGRLLRAAEAEGLESIVPVRSVTIRQPIRWPLVQRWPLYALIGALLTAEWLGRRALRLS